ncbi:TadE/TadG family type IV pilus assembly protein [Rhizobium sp. LEGMi198b]|uniref:TadE/TadG family type IV pilus assembly protein n=1 Tax=unclassified Rhizobium TaxID=2613769 RepID=UPI000CDF3E76|nr:MULTISPECIES: TadE/TadG family type IV pilus assembly protein [Rhizobium]AVA24573.1 Flp pilus assembly Tad-like protein [Rhizobium sp. NXC24]MDK4740500.1 pilus assembly protein [Rhizobium sp. CNPSo 3464]UWU24490.1 pilus assembly protein [Rhizobium tropici]WFU05466.1 pilus assembly protein [Rhizobium sp. CB3171]
MIFIHVAGKKALQLRAGLRHFLRDISGNAAVEFALIAPVFILILAGSLDLGMLIFSRFQLEATVSDSASYAMVNADLVDGKDGSDLATKIATMIASEYAAGDTQASVNVNNGAVANYNGAKIVISGNVSQADACYCPSGSASSLDWGSQQSCGSSCPDGGRAGRFVSVMVKQAYTPLFSGYGLVKGDFIDASAIVRTQ